MSTVWREIRVFISSTFRDMHAERDHLVKAVFPRLRERLLGYRIHLVDIDLRWGVTKEQADNDEVLDLCLDEIDRCRPFFIGLLGERYGWVPTSYPVKGESKQGWVQTHTGKSVTELEILYGVLDNPAMRRHAFFYFRDPACLDAVPEPLRSDTYVETEQTQKRTLRKLKTRIRKSGFPVMKKYSATWDGHRLTDLDAFGEAVLAQLWSAIQAEFKLPDEPPVFAHDSLAEERDLHQRFAELRRRVYVPRPAIHADLLRYLDEPSSKPLVRRVEGAVRYRRRDSRRLPGIGNDIPRMARAGAGRAKCADGDQHTQPRRAHPPGLSRLHVATLTEGQMASIIE